jgi:hypothetical protein
VLTGIGTEAPDDNLAQQVFSQKIETWLSCEVSQNSLSARDPDLYLTAEVVEGKIIWDEG